MTAKEEMTMLQNLQELSNTVADATGRLAAVLGGVRDAISNAESEIAALERAVPPDADLHAAVDAMVDDAAGQWSRSHSGELLAALSPPLGRDARTGELWPDDRRPRLPDFVLRPDLTDLLGLFPQHVKARLHEMLASAAKDGPRIPRAERRARVQAAEAHAQDLARTEESIIREARAAGIPIARRSDVQNAMRDRRDELRKQSETLTRDIDANERNATAVRRDSDSYTRYQQQAAALREELAPIVAAIADLEARM